ncbi:hypothetical protein HDK77DRAFT_258022 [Phyllosticta capitalensis]
MASKRAASTESDNIPLAKRTHLDAQNGNITRYPRNIEAPTHDHPPLRHEQSCTPTQHDSASSPSRPWYQGYFSLSSNSRLPDPVNIGPVASIDSVPLPPRFFAPPPPSASQTSGPHSAYTPESRLQLLNSGVSGVTSRTSVSCPSKSSDLGVQEASSSLTSDQIRESLSSYARQSRNQRRQNQKEVDLNLTSDQIQERLSDYARQNQDERRQCQMDMDFNRVSQAVREKISEDKPICQYLAVRGKADFIASSIDSIVQRVRSGREQSWHIDFQMRMSAIVNLRKIGEMIAELDDYVGLEVRRDFLMEGNPFSEGLIYLAGSFSATERMQLLDSHETGDGWTFEERMVELIEICEARRIVVPHLRRAVEILQVHNRGANGSTNDTEECVSVSESSRELLLGLNRRF